MKIRGEINCYVYSRGALDQEKPIPSVRVQLYHQFTGTSSMVRSSIHPVIHSPQLNTSFFTIIAPFYYSSFQYTTPFYHHFY